MYYFICVVIPHASFRFFNTKNNSAIPPGRTPIVHLYLKPHRFAHILLLNDRKTSAFYARVAFFPAPSPLQTAKKFQALIPSANIRVPSKLPRFTAFCTTLLLRA